MSSAKMTLIGCYNSVPDLFEHLTVPTGIDKETLVDNILLQGGEFEVLLSDPFFLKDTMKIFSRKWERTFKKWVDALEVEYSAVDNYDRFEEWVDKTRTDAKMKADEEINNSLSSTDRSKSSGNGSTDTKNKVSGYNDNQMVDNSEDNIKNDSFNQTSSDALQKGRNVTSSLNKNETDVVSSHTAHIRGNIGVSTSSSIWLEYMDAQRWNIINHITDIFLREYVIPVY